MAGLFAGPVDSYNRALASYAKTQNFNDAQRLRYTDPVDHGFIPDQKPVLNGRDRARPNQRLITPPPVATPRADLDSSSYEGQLGVDPGEAGVKPGDDRFAPPVDPSSRATTNPNLYDRVAQENIVDKTSVLQRAFNIPFVLADALIDTGAQIVAGVLRIGDKVIFHPGQSQRERAKAIDNVARTFQKFTDGRVFTGQQDATVTTQARVGGIAGADIKRAVSDITTQLQKRQLGPLSGLIVLDASAPSQYRQRRRRDVAAAEKAAFDWYDDFSETGARAYFTLITNSEELVIAKADPVGFYNKTIAPTLGTAAAPTPAPTPNPTPTLPPRDAIKVIKAFASVESSNNPNAKSKTSSASGLLGVTDATVKSPQFDIRPGVDTSPAEKNRVGREMIAALMRLYPDDPAKWSLGYHNGAGAAAKWDGTDAGLKSAITFGHRKTTDADVTAALNHRSKLFKALGYVPVAPTLAVTPSAPVVAPTVPQTAADKGRIVIGASGKTRKNPTPAGLAEAMPKSEGSLVRAVLRNPKAKPRWISPAVVNAELHSANQQRSELYKLARYYRAAGPGFNAQYLKAVVSLNAMNETMMHLANQKAVNLVEAGDGRMLAKLWEQENPGEKHQLVPRSDGKWDHHINGQIVPGGEGLTTKSITRNMRQKMSLKYAKSIRAAEAASAVERQKSKNKLINDLLLEGLKHSNLAQIEEAKRRGGFKLLKDEEGRVIQVYNDGRANRFAYETTKGLDGKGPTREVFTRTGVAGTPLVLGGGGGPRMIDAILNFRNAHRNM
jgi:hypothetical protein